VAFSPTHLPHFVNLSLSAESAENALLSIAEKAVGLQLVEGSWGEALVIREAEFATGLPTAIPVAIPHTDSSHVRVDGFGFFRLSSPVKFVEMGSLNTLLDVQLIFPLLVTNPADQVDLLQAIIELVQQTGKLEALMSAKLESEVAELLGR